MSDSAQIILVSDPTDTAAREAIAKWQKVGRAQKTYFDKYGDIETKMMDNSPEGAYEESTEAPLRAGICAAAKTLSNEEALQQDLTHRLDYGGAGRASVYMPEEGGYNTTSQLESGLQTRIYFKLPYVHPTELSYAEASACVRSRREDIALVEVTSQPKAHAPCAQVRPEELSFFLADKFEKRQPQPMIADQASSGVSGCFSAPGTGISRA